MSGFVGVVHFDGSPVDRALFNGMTEFLRFRGPDVQRTFVKENVGLGHALFRTTFESEHEQQPFSLDGETWIVADARVDAQEELRAKLQAKGEAPVGSTDVELLLRAYRAWGADCVEHLLGDFAFAIWDGPRRRLFCARDHLGVKPFFYAQFGQTLIVSNTLDCIRQHPLVSQELNDLAIADFLLFEMNMDAATTSFADIQRIPPAHRAMWWAEGGRTERYWTLPIEEPVYYTRAEDYTERFTELLNEAVGDRLRTDKVGVFMSGGLDSPTLAATACQILRGRSSASEVHAFTASVEGLDGNERQYAQLVADYLKIPIHFREWGGDRMEPDWYDHPIHTPEPVSNPMRLRGVFEGYRSAGEVARVWLWGEGPDNALWYEWRPYIQYLARKGRYLRLVREITGQAIRNRHVPLLGAIAAKLQGRTSGNLPVTPPAWLARSLQDRFPLAARSEEWERERYLSLHPVRPVAYRSFCAPIWESFFQDFDAAFTGGSVEFRHPFVDVRLLRFLLTVPPIPWCRAKYLIRRAMQGRLPEVILQAPKRPLTRDPYWEGALRSGLPPLAPAPGLSRYVDCGSVPRTVASEASFRVDVRPYALNYWSRGLIRDSMETEGSDVTQSAGE